MNFFQRLVDKKRAKQALIYFRDKKLTKPQLSEDEISRLMLRNWIYRTSPMKDPNTIDVYINDLFKNKDLTLVKTCCIGIRQEFPKVYSYEALKNKNVTLDEYSKILKDLETRVRDVVKIGMLSQ